MAGSRYSEEDPPPEVVEDVRRRLAGVCVDWPRALFDSVTARAAWIEFKYDRAMSENFKSLSLRATSSGHVAARSKHEGSSPGNP